MNIFQRTFVTFYEREQTEQEVLVVGTNIYEKNGRLKISKEQTSTSSVQHEKKMKPCQLKDVFCLFSANSIQ